MSIAGVTETAILQLVFNATAWANYAINATTTPQTAISVALHTADPGTAGTQATSEVGYTNYARMTPARTAAAWPVTGTNPASASPFAEIDFPAGGAGGTNLTAAFFSTGATGGGATAILWSGSVTPSITCGSGITPALTTATTITLT